MGLYNPNTTGGDYHAYPLFMFVDRVENWLGQSVDRLTGRKGIDVDRANDHMAWVMTISSIVVTICAVSSSLFYFI